MKRKTIYMVGILFCIIGSLRPVYSSANDLLQTPGITDEKMADKIRIYPNPSDGRFQINMDFEGNDRIVAKVYDITGKVVKDISNDLVQTEAKLRADVDLDHPSSGIYFLRVEIGTKMTTRKIIIK